MDLFSEKRTVTQTATFSFILLYRALKTLTDMSKLILFFSLIGLHMLLAKKLVMRQLCPDMIDISF